MAWNHQLVVLYFGNIWHQTSTQDAMKLLIQHGAKVNVKTGQPPLHMACAADSMEAGVVITF